ncbi:MAG: oligosaccharide flippase family protein [Balneola sp.]
MKQLKELFSDTLIYGVSSVFTRFISYLLVPFYTGVFNTDEYGIISLIYVLVAFLNVVFTYGMESTYFRYAKDREKAKDIFKTLQVCLFGTTILLVGIVWVLNPIINPIIGLAEPFPLLTLMLGILAFDTLSAVPFAELRLARKPVHFAILKFLNVLINISLNLYLILEVNLGIEAVLISNVLASIVTAIIVWILTFDMLKGVWDGEFLKKATVFGLPFVPAGIGYVTNEMLDRIFLKKLDSETLTSLYGLASDGLEYTGEDIVGIYSACYKLAVVMLLFVTVFKFAWQPFFMLKSDQEDAPKLFSETFRYFNLGAAFIFVFFSLFISFIVEIQIPFTDATLIGKDYWLGLNIVSPLLMAYWFQGWYINFSAGIFIGDKTKVLAFITLIGASITLIGNIVLVPSFGMIASAYTTLGSYAVMALIIYSYSKKAFDVPYKLWQGFFVIAIAEFSLALQPLAVEIIGSKIWAATVLFIISMSVLGLMTVKNFFLKE